jgi:hypothetical protein
MKDARDLVKRTKDIREAVEKQPDFDPLVDPTGITVKNMNGDVALNRHRSQLSAILGSRGGEAGAARHRHAQPPEGGSATGRLPRRCVANHGRQQHALDGQGVPGSVEASACDGNVWLTGKVRNHCTAPRVIAMRERQVNGSQVPGEELRCRPPVTPNHHASLKGSPQVKPE